jgi:hypothetical protein
LRVLSGSLEIVPEPMSLRWIHDVFGNSVAIATFDERAETLTFSSTATVDHNPAEEYTPTPDDPAYFYPFLYSDDEFPDLVQFITPQYGDPDGALSAWARNFLDEEGPTPTFNILSDMTHGIRKAFTYRKRHEHGTQHPLDTLQTRSGTCRDYALFMIEALRRVGLSVHSGRSVAWLCRRRLDPCLGSGLSAERRLDRVRSHQRHCRHQGSRSGGGGARSAPGHPAARHLSRFGRCVCRHGGQHQRRFGGRGSGGLRWKSR